MDASLNSHVKDSLKVSSWVWYAGTDALNEGEAVCYNTDYGTAASGDGRRNSFVERPSSSNNLAFAGVVARNYRASTVGQMVEIYVAGSRGVNIAVGVNTTIDTGFLTFSAGSGTEAGQFVKAGALGLGSAYIRQTTTSILETSLTGTWSLAVDGVTLTVASTTGLAFGDTVVLLGGEDDATGAIVPGKYSVASVTNGTVLVLGSSAVTATPGGALTATGYAFSGSALCQADLMGGDESGGVEFIAPANAGGATVAMSGGTSYILGGITIAADVAIALAQGSYAGEKKSFVLLGAMTTSDVTITPAVTGVQVDGSTALAVVNAIDAAGDSVWLEFKGARWFATDVAGGATQA